MPYYKVRRFIQSKNHPEEMSLIDNIEALKLINSGDSSLYLILDNLTVLLGTPESLSIAIISGIFDELARFSMNDRIFRFLTIFFLKKRHRLPLIKHPANFLIRFEEILTDKPDHDMIQGYLYISCSKQAHQYLLRPNYIKFILFCEFEGVKILYNMVTEKTVQPIDTIQDFTNLVIRSIKVTFANSADFIDVFGHVCSFTRYNPCSASKYYQPIISYLEQDPSQYEFVRGIRAINSILEFCDLEKEEVIGNICHFISHVSSFNGIKATKSVLELIITLIDLYDHTIPLNDFLLLMNVVHQSPFNMILYESAIQLIQESTYYYPSSTRNALNQWTQIFQKKIFDSRLSL